MADLFTIENLFILLMLVLLQAVLGFDNLLYICLESQRAPREKQSSVRKLGIGLAVFLRIALLFLLMAVIEKVQKRRCFLSIPRGFPVSSMSTVSSFCPGVASSSILQSKRSFI